MASKAILLTDAKIKGLKPPSSGQAEVSDSLVPGLRIRMGTSGAQTFILRKRVAGKVRNITIGRYGPRFTLADARKKARTLLSDIEAGGDPAPLRRRANSAALTFSALLPEYLAAKSDRRSVGEMKRILERYVQPQLGDRMADAVTRGDVTRLIDEIAASAPVMARNVHAQLSAFYTWAMPRLDRLQANPCRDAGRPPAPPARDRVLSEDELRALWAIADDEPAPWGPALKLLMLTGARRDEVFNADRAEFNLKAREWMIPAARAKNGLPHIIPLSEQAVRVVKAIAAIEGSAKLFVARGNDERGPSGFSKATARLRSAMAEKLEIPSTDLPRWTLHDIRRTVATGMQRLGIRLEVTEAVLNHVSGTRGGIAGVYQRHDWKSEKRTALEAWARELDRIRRGRRGSASNVVKLERSK